MKTNSSNNQKSLRERKKESCRQTIYEAAVQLFLDKGYEQTTVDEIAVEANVSKATFFNYFSRKEEIVKYYADAMFKAIQEGWQGVQLSATSSSIDRIKHMVQTIIDLYESRKEEVHILLWRRVNILGQDEKFPLDNHKILIDTLKNTISEGQKRGEIRSDIDAGILAEDLFIIILYNLGVWSQEGTTKDFMERTSNTLKLLEK
ncbi:MAG: TetR/AcrR family transcriptional regulator [Chitinophagales bacterium]